MFEVVLLYTIFGSTFALSKCLLFFTQPLCAVGLSMSLAGALLLAFSLYHYKKIPATQAEIVLYTQLILFSVMLPYPLRLWAMQSMTSIKAAIIFNLSPLITALFAFLLLGSRITRNQALGLALGLMGIVPVLATGASGGLITSGWPISWAEVAALISTASISYSLLVMQKLVTVHKCPIPIANGVSMFIGGIGTLGLSMFLETMTVTGNAKTFLFFLLLQTVLINLLCMNWRGYLLKRYHATFIAFGSLIAPLSATGYGWLFFDETISWALALSFLCVLIGLSIYSYDKS